MTPALHGNWVDLIILLVLIFFIYQGFIHGFWAILIDFVSFLGSIFLSLFIYKFIANFLTNNFSLETTVANALGFLIAAVLLEITISFALSYAIAKLPPQILKNKLTKILGVILSIVQGLILIAFAINLAISLPISPKIKTDITKSKLGKFILDKTLSVNFPLKIPVNYLSIEGDPAKSIPIDNSNLDLTVDTKSENEMFNLVNQERVSRGIKSLVLEKSLTTIAENYATKMWKEGYFGHYDSKGNDVGNRLDEAGISYTNAGENLALSPDVNIAHTGLMNSPGHRENILETKFKKIGIGVVDNGFYGKIFVQVFTN